MNNIRNDLSGKYILMNDIDLSGIDNWEPIGNWDVRFKGTFDGNGHVIKNLKIHNYGEGIGMFGVTNNAKIKNLGLDNVDVQGFMYTGGLVGSARNNTTITNCFVTGKITGDHYITGGLVGQLYDSDCTINNCYVNADVHGSAMAVGGLAGTSEGSISNCYVIGNVSGHENKGGLAGTASGKITNCYISVNITDDSTSGIFFGQLAQTITQNLYADKNGSTLPDINSDNGYEHYGINDYTTVKSLEHDEFISASTWTNFDDTTWDKSSYPPTLKNMPAASPSTPTGAGGNIRLQVGANADIAANAIYIDISFDLEDLSVDFSDVESCVEAVKTVDKYLKEINDKMSYIGATQNRLDSVEQSQITQIENFTAAKSTIMDADIAQESAEFTKQQILTQTSSALLVQANRLNANTAMSLINSLM